MFPCVSVTRTCEFSLNLHAIICSPCMTISTRVPPPKKNWRFAKVKKVRCAPSSTSPERTLVDEDWHAVCQPIYMGIEGAERENFHSEFVEMNKELSIRSSCHPQLMCKRQVWQMSDAQGRGDECHDPAEEQKIVHRDTVRQEVRTKYSPNLALTKAFGWRSGRKLTEVERKTTLLQGREFVCAPCLVSQRADSLSNWVAQPVGCNNGERDVMGDLYRHHLVGDNSSLKNQTKRDGECTAKKSKRWSKGTKLARTLEEKRVYQRPPKDCGSLREQDQTLGERVACNTSQESGKLCDCQGLMCGKKNH